MEHESDEPVSWTQLGWAALWFLFGVCLVCWVLFVATYTMTGLILGFGLSTAGDYIWALSLFIFSPLALGTAYISLHHQRFDLWSATLICATPVALLWTSRLSDFAVGIDVLAFALVCAAVWRRNVGVTTAFVVVLGFALTMWVAMDGKLTIYELT